ncbi:MAG: dihydrodipicolinate synthase family protein [[Clostridium] innocuum]
MRRLKQQHPNFLIYSGEDGFFDEGLDAGMDGLISVMGHVCMKELRIFCDDERVDNRMRRRLYELAS